MSNKSISHISEYYNEKFSLHGPTPHGVDWNGLSSQFQRFVELCKVLNTKKNFSINDFGCGYGALYEFLIQSGYKNFQYNGNDISSLMIQSAQKRFEGLNDVSFVESSKPQKISDFSIASGVMNVKLNEKDVNWKLEVQKILDLLNKYSKLGFSFNCLTSYSDQEKMKDYLYYADPLQMFDYCKMEFSQNIALLHDYNLYEFSILVKK